MSGDGIRDEVFARVSMRDILRHYAPRGKFVVVGTNSNEFRCDCPFHDDRNQTFSVNEAKLTFRCYAARCGCSGGVLDFVVQLGGATTRGEAFERLADMTGVKLPHRRSKPDATFRRKAPAPLRRPVDPLEREAAAKADDQPLERPPANAAQPGPGMTMWAPGKGELIKISSNLTTAHRYADADDATLGYVLRFERWKDGVREKKWFTPLTWRSTRKSETFDAGPGWTQAGFGSPRPLYRLEMVARRSHASRYVIVEGEKAANFAQKWIDGQADARPTVMLSICGGANGGYAHSDLQALARAIRRQHDASDIYVWPDADVPRTEMEISRGRARSLEMAETFAENLAAALERAATDPAPASDDDAMLASLSDAADTFSSHRVHLVDPDPAWPEKFDLADIDKIGMTLVNFEIVLSAARRVESPPPPRTPPASGDEDGRRLDAPEPDIARVVPDMADRDDAARDLDEFDANEPGPGDVAQPVAGAQMTRALRQLAPSAADDVVVEQTQFDATIAGGDARMAGDPVLSTDPMAVPDGDVRDALTTSNAGDYDWDDPMAIAPEGAADVLTFARPAQADAARPFVETAEVGLGEDHPLAGGLDEGGVGEVPVRAAGVARSAPRWLGYGKGYFYALAASTNEIVAIRRSQMGGPSGLTQVANETYWQDAYPPVGKGYANWERAASEAREACQEAGVFNPARARGRGVWSATPQTGPTDDLAYIVNSGGEAMRLTWNDAGADPRLGVALPLDVYGEAVFVSGADRAHADDDRFGDLLSEQIDAPPSPRHFDKLDAVLSKLPFAPRDALSGPVVLRGWMALAPLNGLLPVRPHLWLTGVSGSGKSWVAKNVVRRLLRPWSFGFARPISEKKLGLEIGADALPVILDDLRIDDRGDEKRFQEMIRLARACARQDEAADLASSAEDETLGHVLRSAFLFVCPDGMSQSDADASRFAPLVFMPRANDGVNFTRDVAAPAEAFADPGEQMRFIARSIFRAPAILEAIPHFVAAMSRHVERRIADLYAPLLAGWFGHAFDGRIASEDDAKSFIQGESRARALHHVAMSRSQIEMIAADDESELLRFKQCAIEVLDPESRTTLRYGLAKLIGATFDDRAPGGGASLEAVQRALHHLGVKILLPDDRRPKARREGDDDLTVPWAGGVLFAPGSPLFMRLKRDGLATPERFLQRLPGVFETARLRFDPLDRVHAWCMPISYFAGERVDIAPRAMVDGDNVRVVDFRKSEAGGYAVDPFSDDALMTDALRDHEPLADEGPPEDYTRGRGRDDEGDRR